MQKQREKKRKVAAVIRELPEWISLVCGIADYRELPEWICLVSDSKEQENKKETKKIFLARCQNMFYVPSEEFMGVSHLSRLSLCDKVGLTAEIHENIGFYGSRFRILTIPNGLLMISIHYSEEPDLKIISSLTRPQRPSHARTRSSH